LLIVFSFTSAVTTSLQYTVSNQLFEKDQTEQGYVYHVIITSLGSILGPVVGGTFTIYFICQLWFSSFRFIS
jgi:hypothetical protein